MDVSFFVWLGGTYVSPSHVLALVGFGFLVWVVFQLLLGWEKRFSHPSAYVALCWLGWDEDWKNVDNSIFSACKSSAIYDFKARRPAFDLFLILASFTFRPQKALP